MAPDEGERPTPEIGAFLDRPTQDLEDWKWLWRGDHRFPARSHRPLLGRLVLAVKKLLRPLVVAPQADLWDRQRTFNEVLIDHLLSLREQMGLLHERFDRLGRDLQEVQGELGADLRSVQADYIRDVGELGARLEFLEAFLRDGLRELMEHNDALFSRVDQKLDRVRREAGHRPGGRQQ